MLSIRKRLGIAVAVVTMTGLLASCTSGAAEEATEAEMRTVSTAYGEVSIPVAPQRIVAIDMTAEVLVRYGVIPVGVEGTAEQLMAPEEWAKIADVPDIEPSWREYDFEQIQQLQPDLIVGTTWDGTDTANFEQLSKIAPTAMISLQNDSDLPTQQAMFEVADVIGKRAEAQQDLDAFTAKAEEIRTTYAAEIKTAVWAPVFAEEPGQFYVSTPEDFTGQLLAQVDATLVAVAKPTGEGAVALSLENVDQLGDATVIVYDVGENSGEPSAETRELLDFQGFKTLDAVQTGHVYPVRHGGGRTFHSLTLGLGEIQQILDELAAA